MELVADGWYVNTQSEVYNKVAQFKNLYHNIFIYT